MLIKKSVNYVIDLFISLSKVTKIHSYL